MLDEKNWILAGGGLQRSNFFIAREGVSNQEPEDAGSEEAEAEEEAEDAEEDEEEEEEDDDDDEPEDVFPALREQAADGVCHSFKHHFEECAERVTAAQQDPDYEKQEHKETCVEELYVFGKVGRQPLAILY